MNQQTGDLGKTVNDTLRGNPLIAKQVSVREGSEPFPRTCGLCEYGDDDGQYAGKCLLSNRGNGTPHALFQIEDGQSIPRTLDGKEVGNYCPSWIPFEAEMN